MLRAREISARELLDAHLDRIERAQPGGERRRDPGRRRRAGRRGRRRCRPGGRRGRSARCTACRSRTRTPTPRAGMRTTWGSPLHADTVPLRDELVVARLKAAGRDPGRQDQRAGVRRRVAHVQPALRRDAQPVPARAVGRRVVGRRGGRARCRLRAARRGQRHGRLAAQPGRRSATSSGCGPRRGGCRPGRRPMGWSQLSVQGPMGPGRDRAVHQPRHRRGEPAQADQQMTSLVDTWLARQDDGGQRRAQPGAVRAQVARDGPLQPDPRVPAHRPGHRAGRRLRRAPGRAHRLGPPGPGGQGALRRHRAARGPRAAAGQPRTTARVGRGADRDPVA